MIKELQNFQEKLHHLRMKINEQKAPRLIQGALLKNQTILNILELPL